MVGEIAKRKEDMPIRNYMLEELLPNSLMSSPAVSIRTMDKVSGVASLLAHHLETFTDSLVVTKDDQPIGIIGSIEILDGVLKNPTGSFFYDITAEQIMNTDKLIVLKPQITLLDLLQHWRQTKRAFAIIPNQYHGYSVISARKLLEIGIGCKTNLCISDTPKRDLITFREDDSVKEIILSMFENQTRKLILKGTPFFISDRIIIEKTVYL